MVIWRFVSEVNANVAKKRKLGVDAMDTPSTGEWLGVLKRIIRSLGWLTVTVVGLNSVGARNRY